MSNNLTICAVIGTDDVSNSRISRRSFLSGISLSFCLASCGGGETGSPAYTLLPTATPTPTASPTAVATQTAVSNFEGLKPASAWTGVAGSGFAGSTPTDPVRSTAKPVLRPLQPSNIWFADSLTIGVWAAAKSENFSSDNLGISKVILHYEGNRTEITQPTVHSFKDANGVERRYLGWWAQIARPSVTTGHAHVYWEAIPLDSSMQSRVIGPFQYSPQSSVYDAELVVAPSAIAQPGKTFHSITSALDWCVSNKRQNPLITITDSGTYDLGRISGFYQGEGYATITATAKVKIVGSAGGTGFFRPGYTGLRFMSDNITIDFENSTEFFVESGTTYNRPAWFDGCNLTLSSGRYSLVNKAPRNGFAGLVRGRPCFTEANITNLWNPAVSAGLVRGTTFIRCWGDIATNAEVVVGNRVDDYDSAEYREEIPSLTVVYTGPEARASLSMDGFNNMARTFTAQAGSTTYTFKIESSSSAAASNTNYSVANVVNWLNSLPGWSATLLDDSRRAACIQKAKTVGSWTVDNVKNTPVTLVTMIDVHADFYQAWRVENIVVADNIVTEAACQNIFLKDGFTRDVFIVNNAFHNRLETTMASQLASVQSHVVIMHNSASGQRWAFRADLTGAPGSTAEKYQPDSYCLFSHNAIPSMTWAGTPVGSVIHNNHIFAGGKIPANSTGTTIGGTAADLFANPRTGDFTPRGALLSNRRPPMARFDQTKRSRLNADAVGARSEMTSTV